MVSTDGVPEIIVEGVPLPWSNLKDQLELDPKG